MVVGYSAKSCVSFKIFLNLFLWLFSIAWIGSLAMGITYMAAPIATSLCDRWGCRVVMCLGSVTYMAAMLLTSVVQHMSLMYITYGVLFGFASSCCYFSSFYILIVYFNKHLALANGIAAAGAGAGTMSLSLTVDKLIASYGLRMTFKGLAALSVCLFLAGLTFLPIDFREGEDKLLKKEALLKEQEEIKIKDRLVKNIKELFKPAPVWGNKPFVAWTVALAMVLIAYYIPYMYLVSSFKLLYTTECLLGLTDGQGDLKPYFTLKKNAAGNLFLLTKTKTRTRTEWNLGSRLTKLIHCCTYSLSKVPWNPPIHELFPHIIIPIHPYLICVGFFLIGSSCRECRHTVNSGGPSGWLFCLGPNSRQDLLWEAWGLISGQPFDPYANSSFGHRCGSMSVPLGPVPLSPSHLLLGVGALWWMP